jgi:subtilisin family serine protease
MVRSLFLAVLVSFAVSVSAFGGNGEIIRAQRAVRNSYIVTLTADQFDVPGVAARLAGRHNAKISKVFTHVLRGFVIEANEAQARALGLDAAVADVYEDALTAQPAATVQQWPLPSGAWGLDRVDSQSRQFDNAYFHEYTGSGVDAYVIDSGVTDLNGAEFGSRLQRLNFSGDGTPDDLCNHGTKVASILGGTAYGVAKGVRIKSLKVFTPSGNDCPASEAVIASALDYAVADLAASGRRGVINMSMANMSVATENAIKNTIAAGVPVVISAGNEWQNPVCSRLGARLGNPAYWGYNPASLSAITVGATDYYDSFVISYAAGACIDILAPGSAVNATHAMGPTGPGPMWGTSAAAPFVAGVVALHQERLAAALPTPSMLEAAVKDNATAGAIGGLPLDTVNLFVYTRLKGGRIRPCCAY